ncbi:hypothetical protein [Caballeronia concitans]|uniref:hypothetical protein n=1 Tax=Caballeronia concitans TaxID=1777133 RepID=UPI001FCBCE60|nr:hypothetical protein [Caballeronia concitans]
MKLPSRGVAPESAVSDKAGAVQDSLRQAPSEVYRLYLTIGKMLDDPRRTFEVRQRLHIGMTVRYIGDNPLGAPLEGTVTELRHTQAVIQDNVTRRRWAVLYAAILLDATAAPTQKEAPPPRPRPEEFFIGDTVGFTDKHLNERVGTVVRLNAKNGVHRRDRSRRTLARLVRSTAEDPRYLMNLSTRDALTCAIHRHHFTFLKTLFLAF